MILRALLWLTFISVASGSALAAVDLALPTPNTALTAGGPASVLFQDAGSGDPESGGCGCVRSSGTQFHEGIDIKPVARNRQGEPTDPIYAAMSGVVRHVNNVAGDSTYGRYIVIEHTEATPAVYSLYAHLSQVAAGIRAGTRVELGQAIGIMGHSASNGLPRERSHLHFELGLALTTNFQTWYDRQKFGSRNTQGMWNGYNLMGFDALAFYRENKAGRVQDFAGYLARMPVAARVRIATSRVPDFARRYPSLVKMPLPEVISGWEITFAWTGLPIALRPLAALDTLGMKQNTPVLLDVNEQIERDYRCKTLVLKRNGAWVVGKDLQQVLGLMFGI